MIKKVLFSLTILCTLAYAQTLEQSVARVLETNPIVLERLGNYRETSQDLSIAKSEYLPTLDLVSSIGHENTDNSNSNILAKETSLNYYENSLTLMLNIFDGFGTTSKVDYQKSRILAAAYNFIEKANDIAFQMTKTYIDVIKQRELLSTAEENVESNAKIFDKIKDLYIAGIATKSEMKKIESSLFLARSNLVVQENNAMDSLFSFKKIYGDKIDINSLEIPTFEVYLPTTLNEAMEYTIRNNPSIMVANYNIKAAEYLKEQKEKDYYPKVDLIAQQNLDNNTFGLEADRNRARVGVVLTYNLYRGGADKDATQKSISAIYREVQTKNELQREAMEGLELSWSAYTKIAKQLEELKKYKEFSEETLSLYQEEYDIGRRSLLDLLSAQNDVINAKSQIIKAHYDRLFAQYRILDSMGLLVAGIMGNDYQYMRNVGLTGINAVDNKDTLPISYDEDHDNIATQEDLCQTSYGDVNILSNGCTDTSKLFSSVKHFALVHFTKNGATVDSNGSKYEFDKIINEIKQNQEHLVNVLIQAHSAKSNNLKADYEFSLKNGNKVKNILVNSGINANKIDVVANGSTVPISSKNTLNNRVNIMLYTK